MYNMIIIDVEAIKVGKLNSSRTGQVGIWNYSWLYTKSRFTRGWKGGFVMSFFIERQHTAIIWAAGSKPRKTLRGFWCFMTTCIYANMRIKLPPGKEEKMWVFLQSFTYGKMYTVICSHLLLWCELK